MEHKQAGVKDMSKAIPATEMFTTKRVEGEPDLVAILNRDIITEYGKEAGSIFINDAEIINVKELNPISQRIIINKWLTARLLRYRTVVENKAVGEVLLYVANDGTVDSWLELLRGVVLPFFKKYDVLFTIKQ